VQAQRKGVGKGKDIEVEKLEDRYEQTAAASLYYACREAGVPRLVEEIARYSGAHQDEIKRVYDSMKKALKLNPVVPRTQLYVPRICGDLKLSGAVQRKAIEILDAAEKAGIDTAAGLKKYLGAAIYRASIVCRERRTQREVSDVTYQTQVTIRNGYNEIEARLDASVWGPKDTRS